MRAADIDQIVNSLGDPVLEPSEETQRRLRERMAEELSSLQAEREARSMGLGLIYSFAHRHLKERPFVYLIPGAAAITLVTRLALGESFIMLARMLAGR